MHQVEGVVDALKRHRVRDQVVDIDAPFHVPVDDFGHVAPAPGAAERGAFPGTAGDQLERTRGDFLALRRHADYHARAPSALTAFQRLTHQLDVAHAFEGKVRAAAGQVDQVGHQLALDLFGIDEVGHPELLGDRLARRIEVDADDHARPRHPRPLHDVEPDSAQAEHHHAAADLHFGGVNHRADSGRNTASDVTDLVA